jgi:hypothetical protein
MKKRFRRSTMASIAGGLLIFLAACGPIAPGANTGGPTAAAHTAAPASVDTCLAQPTATPAAPVPAEQPATDDLTPLSDEFNDAASLASWKNLSTVEGWPSQIERMDVNATSPGALYLVPYTSTWFDDYHGVFLYKEVTGDFMVTTHIKATGKHRAIPTSAYSLTGIMARTPRDGLTPATWQPGHENWVFITTGIGQAGFHEPQIETKTTLNSLSDLRLIPSAADWIDLRVVRVGRTFVMLYRLPGASWQLSRCFDRPDLPQRLRVGLNAYTDWDPIDSQFHGDGGAFNRTLPKGPETHPDLIVRDDSMRFSRPPVPDAVKAQIVSGGLSFDTWLHFVTR